MQIVLFCHVEPGTSRSRTILFHSHRKEGIVVALPRIVEFADLHHIPMTFAMTPVALASNETDLQGHEVGIHLHPLDSLLRTTVGHTFPFASDCLALYSLEDQAVLIRTAKEIFERYEDRSPRTFVAGRWSEDSTTSKLLCDSGFAYDGSPLPRHRSPCADWSRVPRLAQPYTPSLEDHQSRGSLSLLYVPVYQGLWDYYLTPENIHLVGASYFRAALKEAEVGGSTVVHVYFHSPMAIDPFFLSEFDSVVVYAQDTLGADFVLPSALHPSARPTSNPFPPAYLAGLNWRLAKSLLGRGELGHRVAGHRLPSQGLKASKDVSESEEDAE